MSSPFGDDAEHPDRPDTLDFWRLSQVVLGLDATAQDLKGDHTALMASFEGYVDQNSVVYLAEQRARIMLDYLAEQSTGGILAITGETLEMLMTSCMVTGVMIGIRFEKEGGHRDG